MIRACVVARAARHKEADSLLRAAAAPERLSERQFRFGSAQAIFSGHADDDDDDDGGGGVPSRLCRLIALS